MPRFITKLTSGMVFCNRFMHSLSWDILIYWSIVWAYYLYRRAQINQNVVTILYSKERTESMNSAHKIIYFHFVAYIYIETDWSHHHYYHHWSLPIIIYLMISIITITESRLGPKTKHCSEWAKWVCPTHSKISASSEIQCFNCFTTSMKCLAHTSAQHRTSFHFPFQPEQVNTVFGFHHYNTL